MDLKSLFVPVQQAADYVGGITRYQKPVQPTIAQPDPWKPVAGVVFGEAPNHEPDMRAIASTIWNRVNHPQNAGKTAADIVMQQGSNGIPQYNAYGGNQYNNYINGKLDMISKKKAALVDAIIAEMKAGTFKPTTSATSFHDEHGKIVLDNKPLFAPIR